ncbi:alpha-2,8-sialyltransferase 8E-like [Branchiostoma floridae]|uniref:Alpha-2,8-sialyltransferase 8E-like n=1 Tax=Branchiostoma floridae TaxID=7739 RepID=A0A9J7M7C6_BRAFL|nr:alpha-2,8-sialyltransferase 8E-like [Branchiostoma floridae]
MKGFPKLSPFENKRFNTCSLVGNGGILKGSGCGKEIDASEFVFRFNMAPMDEKYLEDIGNKTNLITMNPSMIKYRYRKGRREESTIDVKTLMSDLSATASGEFRHTGMRGGALVRLLALPLRQEQQTPD